MKRKIFGATLACLCIAATSLGAQTQRKTVRQVSMFADVKAHAVGDIVTVEIVERAKATNTSSTSSQTNTKFDNKADAGTGALSFLPDFGMSATSSRNQTGGGQTTREGKLTATLAATVQEVRPNGDMVISGQREVQVNGEKELLTLTGVVRPTDIRSGNVVESTNIADAKILYQGKGTVTKGSKPNIIVRFFSWLF